MNTDPSNPISDTPDASSENLLALALSKSDESFPILKAFQGYIEQERERARRRTMTLSICFAAAIVVIVLVFGVFFGMFFMSTLRHNDLQQGKILDYLSSSASAQVQTERERALDQQRAEERRRDQEELRQLREQIKALAEQSQAQKPAANADASTTKELLQLVRELAADRSTVAPAQSAPVQVIVPTAPVAEPALAPTQDPPKSAKAEATQSALAVDSALTNPQRGVISKSSKEAQLEKLAAEERARKERALQRAEAERLAKESSTAASTPIAAPAAVEVKPSPVSATKPKPTAPATTTQPAIKPATTPAVAAPKVMGEQARLTPAAKDPGIIRVQKLQNMKLPEGTSADSVEVISSSGVMVPVRTLLPLPDVR